MNGEERIQLMRQNILRILADCGSCLLPEPRLIDSLQVDVMPPPTRSDCREHIAWLERDDYIIGTVPELGGPRKWKLTDKGRLALREISP